MVLMENFKSIHLLHGLLFVSFSISASSILHLAQKISAESPLKSVPILTPLVRFYDEQLDDTCGRMIQGTRNWESSARSFFF